VKYTNHLNIIIAIVGVVVIAQTLTGTFWNSTPEQKYNVELPAVRPKVLNSAPPAAAITQKRSLFPPPAAPSPVPVTPPAAVVSNPQPVTSQPAPTAPRRNRLFTPGPVPLPQTSAPSTTQPSPTVVTIPSQPATTASPAEGERPLRFQPPFGARNTVRQPVGDPRSMNSPPPSGSDSAKRDQNSDPPTPPVRSSMPEQRVQ